MIRRWSFLVLILVCSSLANAETPPSSLDDQIERAIRQVQEDLEDLSRTPSQKKGDATDALWVWKSANFRAEKELIEKSVSDRSKDSPELRTRWERAGRRLLRSSERSSGENKKMAEEMMRMYFSLPSDATEKEISDAINEAETTLQQEVNRNATELFRLLADNGNNFMADFIRAKLAEAGGEWNKAFVRIGDDLVFGQYAKVAGLVLAKEWMKQSIAHQTPEPRGRRGHNVQLRRNHFGGGP